MSLVTHAPAGPPMHEIAPPRPLRILIALETSGGGSGRHALDLAEGLFERGHAVVVIYSPIRAEPSFLARLESLPVIAVSVPMERSVGPSDIKAFQRTQRVVAEYGPFEVLHAHSSKAGALIRALPASGVKIYTPHAFKSMDPGASRAATLLVGGIEAALGLLATDRVIAVSTAEANHAREVLRIPAHKVTRIVNGVDAQPLRPRADVRAELSLSADEVLVGFVGRLTWQKNPELYLQAMAQVCGQHPHVRGLMMGDGDLDADIRNLRGNLGLDGRVHLISGRSAFDYFAGMDCLALTSRYEAMPYVMLEALAAGVPLISTPVGGAAEAIEPGVTGLLAEADPQAIADAICRIARDKLFRRRLSLASTYRAQRYSVEAMVEQTLQSYYAALGWHDAPETYGAKVA